MVAYGFKKRFVAPIRAGLGLIGLHFHKGQEIPCEFVIDDGETIARPFDPMLDLDAPVRPKRQTIRALGKRRHARPGETLQLYTAMRTKQCKKIGEAKCTAVRDIVITFGKLSGVSVGGSDEPQAHFQGGGLDIFAQRDGFESWNEMVQFWDKEHGLSVFIGKLIEWEPL